MNTNKNLLVIAASDGENLKLANRFVSLGEKMGTNPELLDLTSLDLPLFSPKKHAELGIPSTIEKLHSQMVSNTYWVICAPEYNGGVPPVLSNALTWVSVKSKYWRDSFNGKFAIIATHSGGDGYRFLSAFRSQLEYMGTNVLSRTISVSNENPLNNESATKILNSFINLV